MDRKTKMTQEEKEKLRNILYNKKCIADYREEDPFVGIYFNDLINLLEDYKFSFLHSLEVKDLYDQCIQYSTVKDGIQAHAETYSFNIESELFNQLTKEQQALWRKEIEQACISGGDAGVELAKDPRYKENFEVKEVDLKKKFDKYCEDLYAIDIQEEPFTKMYDCAKHFFELGLKQRKENKL